MLSYAPTLVIGVGHREEPLLKAVLNELRFWLGECSPQIAPIVRLGLVVDSELRDYTERVEETVGRDLTEGIRSWYEAVTNAGAVARVRASDITVVGTERLELRVVIIFFTDCPHEQVASVLRALRESLAKAGAVMCCSVITIVRDDTQARESDLVNWLRVLQPFTPARALLVQRHRSDGSTVDVAVLPLVVQFLLLVALAPYTEVRHPFFVNEGVSGRFTAVGLGLLYVPLPHISQSAGNFLAYELSAVALSDEPLDRPPSRSEATAHTLDEGNFWQALFEGIDAVAEVRMEPTASPEGRFQVALNHRTVLLDLSRTPWHRRKERLVDYELTLRWLLREFWHPKMERNAAYKQEEADRAIQAELDSVVQRGVGVFAAVERTLEQTKRQLHGWQSAKQAVPRGVASAGMQAHYEALDQAVAEAPNPHAVFARALLTCAFITYTAFALARWDWLTTLLNDAVRALFTDAPAWSAWALIGVAWLGAMVATLVKAAQIIREAHERVEQATQAALHNMEHATTAYLREMGLQLLQQTQNNLMNRVEELEKLNQQSAEEFVRARQSWEANARAFHPTDTSLTRAAVQGWHQLEPKVRSRLQGQDLQPLWQQMLKDASVDTFAGLIHRLGDGTLEAQLQRAAEQLWLGTLRLQSIHRISDYLPLEDPEHTRDILTRCYRESRAYLTVSAREGVSWQLHARHEPELNHYIQAVAREQLGNQWLTIQLPAVAGFLKLGWVDGVSDERNTPPTE
ncbi:MAG: hypothetical protein ACUVV1_06565 [Fimbriimonadales bacterium]